MRLETKIEALMPLKGEKFDVIAHELWADGESGWTVNDSWKIARGVDKAGVLEAARGRWEVFKINYLPKARVADITDSGWKETEATLEVDCVAFLNIVAVD